MIQQRGGLFLLLSLSLIGYTNAQHYGHDIVMVNEIFFYTADLPCLQYSNNLSIIASQFLQCALNNSRPLNICRSCLKFFLSYKQLYELMINDNDLYATTLYKNGLTCKNIIEAADRVQIDFQVFSLITNIWNSANCETCFESYSLNNGTATFTYKNDVKIFLDMHQNLTNCIYNFTKVPIPIDPIFDDYSANSTLCAQCKSHYVNFTKHFISMGDENTLCMDVVDAANYTRVIWSKGYQCNYRNPDQMTCLLISGLFTFLTAAFYVLMRIFGHKEPQKRAKLFRRKSSFFGSQLSI